ncbi:MAG TPA: UdgX family uracil-DNA binding protein [Rhodanobacteraceae bacterium]|nr:UdgX family uracil-DNA binding protein [Rhodanobacteraceae bacterium]
MPRPPQDPFIPLAKPVREVPDGSIAALRRKARACHACPLWKPATQTVFGDGPADADVMLIGEQPGLHEDREGEPFVGPAGHVLDRALAEAGLDRGALYMTNTVKHFKYEQRGTAKLHKRASAAEQAACRMWLAAELARVRPKIVIALGAMAAQTLFGNTFRLTRERGEWRQLGEHARGMATWHPSAILRGRERSAEMYRQLVEDLRSIARQR